MSASVQPYLDLVTSEHQGSANFMATIAASLQPLADIAAVTDTIAERFDATEALGAQQDIVGQLVGAPRDIGGYTLSDDRYQLLINAVIAANGWDGSKPGAYAAYAALFKNTGYQMLIVDQAGGPMSVGLALWGPVPDEETVAIIEGGYLALIAAGVRLAFFEVEAIADAPFFALGYETQYMAGFGSGAFGSILEVNA